MTREKLDGLYKRFNRGEFIHPDPLEFLYEYDGEADREVVGIVASTLAYGRVAQILESVKRVLEVLGPSPAEAVVSTPPGVLARGLRGFKHRFTTGEEMARLLTGVGRVIGEFSSLNACFVSFASPTDETVLGALHGFSDAIAGAAGASCGFLVPSPGRGSACKRLNLFLRWMVRRDDVDPGGWEGVSASSLIVPLDTHMHRICTALGLTSRKQADMKTAIEVTDRFREFSPRDPVKYDFALTRLGIRGEMTLEEFMEDGG